MRFLVTSDVHQQYYKWDKLANAVEKTKPDIVLVAGDIVPHDLFNEPQNFVKKTLKKSAKKIANSNAKLFLITGNDDNINVVKYIKEVEEKTGLWYFINNRVVEFEGFEFVGIPYTLDYSFGLKDWIIKETKDDSRFSIFQMGNAIAIGENNKRNIIYNWREELNSRTSFVEVFEQMSSKVKNMNKSIWLIHDPPTGCGLDMTKRGLTVGSKSVMSFILDKQPFLTVHGHIHESPEYTGKWAVKLGETWTVQAGQIENELYYTIIDIIDGKIIKLTHSIYGDYKE
jgi:Icc-related predicted phosphoesterase